MPPRTLSLIDVSWSAHQLRTQVRLGELAFGASFWYPDTDLLDLDRRYGRDLMERVHVHTALFELNKLASFRPIALDLGPYARHHTQALEQLWGTVFHKVWAQWRYENDLPLEQAPPWTSSPRQQRSAPTQRDRDAGALLLFCGGGKDSLVSMKLLERGALPYASFAYAGTAYGRAEPQLRLIDGLLDQGAPIRRERGLVLDDFVDAPVLALYGEELGVRTWTAAETPSSIFSALPVILDRGYSHAVLGHEASANRGNLIWDQTGEDVNHQWGKSLEAERLLDTYIRENLVADAGVFSLLMPIHDVLIFSLLRSDPDALPFTHSCNVAKPWCRRCPKCCYVWLGYRAHLDDEQVRAIFGEDLAEVPENQGFFHDMVGLGLHTPFECIGHLEESRLALAMCGARSLLGPRGKALLARLPPITAQDLDHYLTVHAEARLPAAVAAGVLPQMHAAALEARARITAMLKL